MKKLIIAALIIAVCSCGNDTGNSDGSDTTVTKGNNESRLNSDTSLFSDSTINR